MSKAISSYLYLCYLLAPFLMIILFRDFSGEIHSSSIRSGFVYIGYIIALAVAMMLIILDGFLVRAALPISLLYTILIISGGYVIALTVSASTNNFFYAISDVARYAFPLLSFFLGYLFVRSGGNITMLFQRLFFAISCILVFEVLCGFLVHPYSVRYGTGLIFLFYPLGFYLFIQNRNRIFLSFIVLFSVYLAFVSGSRAILVALLLTLIFSVWKLSAAARSALLILTVMVFLPLGSVFGTFDGIFKRFGQIYVNNQFVLDDSAMGRLVEVESVISEVSENYMFGLGFGSVFTNARAEIDPLSDNRYVHITPVQLYKNGGVSFLLFYGVFLFYIFFYLFKPYVFRYPAALFLFFIVPKFILASGAFFSSLIVLSFFSGCNYFLFKVSRNNN